VKSTIGDAAALFAWPGWDRVFASPVTTGIIAGVGAVLAIALAAITALSLRAKTDAALRRELWLRLGSWIVILPLLLGPILLGKGWMIAMVVVLSLLCLGEFSRATGLFRDPLIPGFVALGVFAVNFAALDHWYGFFVALWPLTVCVIAVCSIPADRPRGYIQRTGLGILAYMLFGAGLAHLGYMSNDPGYRPIVLMLVTAVAFNDVFAFTCGKLIGGPKLLPATSPGKTIAGALGALAGTTALVAWLSHEIFIGSMMDRPHWLILLGLLVSAAGQAGDLMLSSIKRDLGIKDMGAAIPGHGGVLDRFNSLLLVAPASFHFIGYFIGFGLTEPQRILTG
jgi:phosphatidate cytidylyltransferase